MQHAFSQCNLSDGHMPDSLDQSAHSHHTMPRVPSQMNFIGESEPRKLCTAYRTYSAGPGEASAAFELEPTSTAKRLKFNSKALNNLKLLKATRKV